MKRVRGALAAIGVLTVASGCADEIDRGREIVDPISLLDTDADPAVVEVDLYASAAQVSLVEGTSTGVLGYHDSDQRVTIPGPLIEGEVGDTLRLHFHNDLDQPTTVHFHGLRLPVEMDGNPMVSGVVEPGETFDYAFELLDPGLFWYHPHVQTDAQMAMGLKGPMVVRDPDDPAVDRERVLMLDGMTIDDDARVILEPSHEDLMLGRRPNHLMINGVHDGVLRVRSGDVERWRIVNAANGRFFRLGISAHSFRVIGWDAGRLSQSYELDELLVAPGERFDILVAFPDEPGSSLELRTLEVDRGHGGLADAGERLATIDVGNGPGGPIEMPVFAKDVERLVPDEGAQVREFALEEDPDSPAGPLFFINGERWPQNTPVQASLGETEQWTVVNQNDGDHPFHIHGLFFQDLDAQILGWKDTVNVPPHSARRLAVRFTEPGMWMFHCQIPEHAERGMMGDLVVSPP